MDYLFVEKVDLKENDILEISLKIETLIPEEDLAKPIIDNSDYAHEYSITYLLNDDKCIGGCDFKTDAGFLYEYDNNIEGFVKEELKTSFPEIIDYEILETNDIEYEHQYAKIKVIKIKD